jgi:hypothetical protein
LAPSGSSSKTTDSSSSGMSVAAAPFGKPMQSTLELLAETDLLLVYGREVIAARQPAKSV